jgi:pyruvate,water dikinase
MADGAEHRPVTRDDLGALPGGSEFLAELETFLAVHGHMGQGFDDLAFASWGEDPSILLAELGRRLAHPPEDAEARRARLAAEADRLAQAVRERLAERPEDLARFENVLALSRAIGPLTEVHNYWIDRLAQARIRALSIRVGARLAAAGCLEAAEDILYLRRPEVRELIERPTERRDLVLERRRLHAEQAAKKPPLFLGAPRPDSQPDRFDGERRTSTEADLLLGTGASAGIVQGPARITLSAADFGRIRAGDIIVCPSSNPSWIPVFTLAAGLVANTGGILSHAAVVAREFGLPAVVGVTDATTMIAEGRLVEIDGTTGSVRLL